MRQVLHRLTVGTKGEGLSDITRPIIWLHRRLENWEFNPSQ